MTTDPRFDESISKWMEQTAPPRLPERVLEATFERTRRSRQQVGWRALLGRFHITRFASALGSAAVVVVAAAVALNFYLNQLEPGGPRLPTTPGAWERVLIDTPSGTGTVVSLAATPHGLLAVVGEQDGNETTRLAVSTDGRNWTLVPDGQHPSLSSPRSFGYPSVVCTDRGFLLLQLNEVWMSENGYDWRRLAGETTDPDLRMGGPGAATNGGPGLVAVGGDKAWYSADGSDWSVAAVPALPEEILARPDSERYVEMTGVTAAGNDLVAWGIAEVPLADNSDEHLVVPLLWASSDGRTWVSVVDSEMESVTAVTGGPGGFAAAGRAGAEAAVWFSADGDAWERVADDAFTLVNDQGSPVEPLLRSAAATSAGYVLVGGDGLCSTGPCPDQEAVIWTSADGRSWVRVASDDRFTGASANEAVAWGSHFVVGGVYDGKAAIWISGSEQPASGATAGTAPVPAIPTPTPGQPISLAGSWQAIDLDGSQQTMELAEQANGTYGVTILDGRAGACGGVSSTVTGTAEVGRSGRLVTEQLEYMCDDGSQPRPSSGPPLDEPQRFLGFSYDPLRDALFDTRGLEWIRAEVAP